MKLLAPTPDAAVAILRALRSIAVVDQELEPREQAFLQACQRAFGTTVDLETLTPIAPEELASVITDVGARTATVQRLILMALLDEQAKPEEIAIVRAFASALSVADPVIDQMELAAKNRVVRLGVDIFRRGFIGKPFRDAWEKQGFRGLLAAMRAFQGKEVPGLAARYVALGELPEGTLGRTYFAYMKANEFAFPGEPNGPPEMLLFHDIGHALTGFGTDVPGEMQMAGLEAGYMGDDGFSVAALAIFAFHMGVELPKVKASRGGFDYPLFENAWMIGRTMKVDLRSWDPWPHMDRKLSEVRAELGL